MKRSETCEPCEAKIKGRWRLAKYDTAYTGRGTGIAVLWEGKCYTLDTDVVRPRKAPKYKCD